MKRAKGLLLMVGGGGAALLCLAALGGKLLEERLGAELKQRLSERGVAASWRETSWSLREACAHDLSWTHPESASYGRVDEACVLGSPALAWPPFEVSEVSLIAPHLITSVEALSALRTSHGALPLVHQHTHQRSPKSNTLKRALERGLTLSVTKGALWINAKGSPQLSASLTLSVELGGAQGVVEGRGQSSVRLKGFEEPLALNATIKGPLVSPELFLSPLKGAWSLVTERGRLSLEGVSVDLSQQTLRAHQLQLALPPLLSASLTVSAHLPSKQLSASKGHLTLSDALFTEGSAHDLSARFAELSAPLESLRRVAQELRDALNAPHLNARAPLKEGISSQNSALTLLGSHLDVRLGTPKGPLTMRLEQLSASATQGQLLLTSPERPRLSVWGCWGGLCEPRASLPSQAHTPHTPWSLKVRGVDVSSLTSITAPLTERLGHLKTLHERLSRHLSGELSLTLEGSLTGSLTGSPQRSALSLTQLALGLTEGRLTLSQAEPTLSLPPLALSLSQPLKAELSAHPLSPHSLSLHSLTALTSALKGLEGLSFKGNVGAHDHPLRFTGELTWAEGAERLKVEAEELPCQRAFELLPKEALGQIENVKLSGRLAPSLSVSKRGERLKLKLKRLLRRCTFEALTLSPPSTERAERIKVRGHALRERDVSWLNEPFTFQIDPELTGGERVVVGPASGLYVPLKELPLYVGGAMYLTEEMGFWTGGAFSPQLVENALNTNLKRGRFVYGGSTVTQQLVKNLFLSRDKVLTRKLQEVLMSARLLDEVSKERLLELYLNCIEFAPAVFGVQAAARYYFQKEARALSPQEAVFLAMLKVSPKRGARWRRAGRSPSFTWWRQRSVEVFDRLVSKGLLSERQAQGQAPFVLRWDKGGAYLGAELIEP